MSTFRRLAREAVIFTLLGPVLLTVVGLAYFVYTSPAPAEYTKVPQCPETLPKDPPTCTFSGKDGAFLVESQNEGPWPNTEPKLFGYAQSISTKHRYLWLPDQNSVGEFDRDASDASIEAAISRDFPHAYKFKDSLFANHLQSATLAGVIFGWPLGFGLWIFYRVVRFAIKG